MKKIPLSSRRQFIRTAAAGAILVPHLLPSRVWSAEVSPNNRITVGVIGTGKQALGLMDGFLRKEEVQIVAVCDTESTRRANAKRKTEEAYAKRANANFKGCTEYRDFRELLARRDIDAVVIATPDHWHAAISIRAAKAGKDIYCEKPLCQSIKEARAMVDAVRKNKRVFQVGSMQRSSPEFRVACELVRNGIIGRISRVEVAVGGPAKWCDLPETEAPKECDWDMWLGPAPKRGWSEVLSPVGIHDHFPAWRNYREFGGGGVTDWGAHHFDIAQWGLGMDEGGPIETRPSANPASGHGVVHVYDSGTEVHHSSGNGVTFFGEKGRVNVNRGRFEFDLEGRNIAESAKQLPLVEKEFLADAKVKLYKSTDHKQDWLDCIRSRKKPICDVEVGARTVTVCHLTNLAYYHGELMKWNPRRERFRSRTGNKEWLDVPRRDPWASLS